VAENVGVPVPMLAVVMTETSPPFAFKGVLGAAGAVQCVQAKPASAARSRVLPVQKA
jgi:hypothetical protein